MKLARVCAAFLFLEASRSAQAQTANTVTVLGLVADHSGAAVAGAEVQLTDAAASAVRTAIANEMTAAATPLSPSGAGPPRRYGSERRKSHEQDDSSQVRRRQHRRRH